jgi:hypothetical protein
VQIIKTLISSSDSVYRSKISYPFDGLVNNRDYYINLETESSAPQGGIGMILTDDSTFNVDYPELIVKNKPTITQNCDTSGIEIMWAGLCTNPGSLVGIYNYIDDFIKYGNTALNLANGATLTYSSTIIPSDFTLSFMIKLNTGFNGVIFTTSNNHYQVGYDNGQQKFYTTIEGQTVYSELIKITDNPFFLTLLPDHIIIRQYNIYKQINNLKGMKLNTLSGYPLQFMAQTNN